MTTPCRSWWRNCALVADSEILEIDGMEDRIGPVGPNALKIRELISSLELCHHKALRRVHNIIDAIGTGETQKGPGTRPPGQKHSAEMAWQNACDALSAWCAGSPSAEVDLTVDKVPASRLLACLGERTPLKVWQVQRVIEKIQSVTQAGDDPSVQYEWILLGGGEYELAYRSECPDQYKENEDFWRQTVRTIIHDWADGVDAELSLGLAIDMLWPCHWRFVENLQIVLEAISGDLHPAKPFAACGRNLSDVPIREPMEIVSNTLRTYCGAVQPGINVDDQILVRLGTPTDEKRWLTASLEKTIRLQLNPPDDLRAISALTGPDWIQ